MNPACQHQTDLPASIYSSFEKVFDGRVNYCENCNLSDRYFWVCISPLSIDPCSLCICSRCLETHAASHEGRCFYLGSADVYCSECRTFNPRTDKVEISDCFLSSKVLTPGLVKLKNCCYINATLQCLVSVHDLVHFCKELCYFPSDVSEPTKRLAPEVRLVSEFAALVTKLRSYAYECFDPSNFYSLLSEMLPGFNINQQQDSHELMSLLFDRLKHSFSLNGVPNIIEHCFQGKLSNIVKCSNCEWTSITEQSFEILAVPLPSSQALASSRRMTKTSMSSKDSMNYNKVENQGWNWFRRVILADKPHTATIQDCLYGFFAREELDCYRCPDCRSVTQRHFELKTLPKYMIIVVTRTTGSRLLPTDFIFPSFHLEFSQYLSHSEPSDYTLIGAISHRGILGRGHYIAFSKLPSGHWALFNDTSGYIVSEGKILKEKVYILMYQRNRDCF